MERCTNCNKTLKADEVITCNPCEIANLEHLLNSPRWRKARAHMIPEITADLEELKTREGITN
jgi:hypothetical protein